MLRVNRRETQREQRPLALDSGSQYSAADRLVKRNAWSFLLARVVPPQGSGVGR